MPQVATGEGQSSIGNAVVVPEYNQQAFDRFDYYNQLAEQHKAEEEKQKLAEQKRQDALQKYSGGLFKQPNALTGTEYDPVITGGLTTAQSQVNDIIKNDPSLTYSDVQTMAAEKVLPIVQMSEKIKYLNKGLTDMTGGIKNIQGVDGAALQKQALFNLTHDIVNGKPVLKQDVNSIDLSPQNMQNALNDVVDKTPEILMQNPDAVNWKADFDNVKKIPVGDKYKNNYQGKLYNFSYNANLQPYEEIVTDPNTHKPVIDPQTGKPQVAVRSQMAPAAQDGTPSNLKIADNDVYNTFTSGIRGRLFVAKAFNDENAARVKQGLAPIPQNSLAADIKKKEIVYNTLSQNVTPVQTQVDQSDAAAYNQAQINARQQNQFKHQEMMKTTFGTPPKENFINSVSQIIQGNPDYLKGDEQTKNIIPGMPWSATKTGRIDILNTVPGGIIYSDKLKDVMVTDPNDPNVTIPSKTKIPYTAVWYEPKTGDVYTKLHAEDKPENQGPLKDWALKMATLNGVSTRDANVILNKRQAPAAPVKSVTKKSTVTIKTKKGAFDNL